MNRQAAADLLNKIQDIPVMVAGDLMLDIFVYGEADRISPESPVPVLAIQEQKTMPGGAGNVIANIAALGARPVVCSVTGDDTAGVVLRDKLSGIGAAHEGLLIDPSRPTPQKTRYIARGQQIMRGDVEKTHLLDSGMEDLLLQKIRAALPSVKALILSDYGKGVLTPRILGEAIAAAHKARVPVFVDPKGRDFSIYRGADFITPNRKELAEAARTNPLKGDEDIVRAATAVLKECQIACVVATRSEDGMTLVRADAPPLHLKTQARDVYDVSGAGDTVIASFAAARATGCAAEDCARFANIAAGIAVSKQGTAAVRPDEILGFLSRAAGLSLRAPIAADWDEAAHILRGWKDRGLNIGMTGGCFDILHAGHVNYLSEARAQCDRLIVALNRDASVRLLKGPSRPINDEGARATVLAALACVDMVVFFGAEVAGEDNTPRALLEYLRPDIFFKGGDYRAEDLPETKTVRAYGGEVRVQSLFEGYSTTGIIEKTRL